MKEAVLVAGRFELKADVRIDGAEFCPRDGATLNIGNGAFDRSASAALGAGSTSMKQQNSQTNADGSAQRSKWQIHLNPSPMMRSYRVMGIFIPIVRVRLFPRGTSKCVGPQPSRGSVESRRIISEKDRSGCKRQLRALTNQRPNLCPIFYHRNYMH